MNNITVVVPALKTPKNIIEKKILAIANAWPARYRIVVHADSRALSRRYFDSKDGSAKVNEHYRKTVAQWCAELEGELNNSSVNYELNVVWGRKFGENLQGPGQKASDLYVMYSAQRSITQEYRSLISKIEQPILMLFDRPWHSSLSVVAAIDPIHEDDDPALRDIGIIQTAKRFSRSLSGSLLILHSCFVPPYLLSYKEKITSVHRENISSFLEENSFTKVPHTMIHGDPSIVISRYVNDHKVDILAMGSIARGFVERYLLGSTAEDICSNAPCDLLLT